MNVLFLNKARSLLRATLFLTLALVSLSCGGSDSTGPPGAGKYVVSFDPPAPIAGDEMSVVAQIVDAAGNSLRLPGRVVTWSNSAGGTYSPAKSTTLPDGTARTTFITRGLAGRTAQITLSDEGGVAGSSASFLIGVGPPSFYVVTASATFAVAGSAITISAQLADRYGNPVSVPGRVVNWSLVGSGGSLSSQTSTSDANGVATVSLTLGTVANTSYVVRATDGTVGGASNPVFTTAGPAAQYLVTASEVDPPVGAAVTITAQLADANSNPLTGEGLLVSWSASGSGGSFSSDKSFTSKGGAAVVTFTPATVVGASSVVSATDPNGTRGSTGAITTQPQVSLASIATGPFSSSVCGASSGGTAWCWGANPAGQLGNGTMVSRSLPGRVAGNISLASVSISSDFACGISLAGAAYCWGANSTGQLGDDSFTQRIVPVAVASAVKFTAVSAGGAHTCALSTSGDAYCWGYNAYGQLGSGGAGGSSKTPVKVVGGLSFMAVTAGDDHSCGLTTAGIAYCWGSNSSGQLGDNTKVHRAAPTLVAGALTFSSVAAGRAHTCAIESGGGGFCWGDNGNGQLGIGTIYGTQVAPKAVVGGLKLKSIAAGGVHSCATTLQDVAYCWGNNAQGQLGTGNTSSSYSPVTVAGGLLFKSIAAAASNNTGYDDYYYYYYGPSYWAHTCGLTVGGTAYCWGSNENGQLGSGRVVSSSTLPLKVAGQP